jgi:hypothetical protein
MSVGVLCRGTHPQVVLHGRPGEQDATASGTSGQRIDGLVAVAVLQTMAFVTNEKPELRAVQLVGVLSVHLRHSLARTQAVAPQAHQSNDSTCDDDDDDDGKSDRDSSKGKNNTP